MVTFRKDIHLGRRVPMTPKDEDQCMLVSISNEGLAVDKYGRKWQFVAFEERTVMPIVEIVDVTTDATMGGFDPVNYPRIAGKKGGVYRITITEGEEDCTLWYKILKYNEELDIFVEPSDWTQYTDPVVLKARGRYCIKAYASHDGQKNSLEVQSDNFQITQRLLKYNYSFNVTENSLAYDLIPAIGGTVMPRLDYGIIASVVSTDPTYQETQASRSGATAIYSGLDANPTTGAVTKNTPTEYTYNVPIGTVRVDLSYTIPEIDRYGVDPATEYIISATAQAQVGQAGKSASIIRVNPLNWTYDGNEHPIASVSGGTPYWAENEEDLDESTQTAIPKATNAGTYTWYWRLPADDTHVSASGSITATIAKADNVITWDTAPASSITAGGSVTFAAHADDGTVYFEDGSGNAISSPLTNVQNNITIVAKVAATANYNSATSSKAVTVLAPAALAASGVSNTVPTTATPVANPNKTLNISGQSGKVQWVAIPSTMTITSWYDNDESYEMKNEISQGENFTNSGISYTIYYNQLLLSETKNYTIKFS